MKRMKWRILVLAISAPTALYGTWYGNKDKGIVKVLLLFVGGVLSIFVFCWVIDRVLKILHRKGII